MDVAMLLWLPLDGGCNELGSGDTETGAMRPPTAIDPVVRMQRMLLGLQKSLPCQAKRAT